MALHWLFVVCFGALSGVHSARLPEHWHGWRQCADDLDTESPRCLVDFQVRLVPEDPTALSVAADQISDPLSPHFREFIVDSDISQLVRPARGVTEAITAWLSPSAISVVPMRHGDYLAVRATCAGAQKLLSVNFAQYCHPAAKQPVIRTTSKPIAPSHLFDVIASFHGLYELFPVVRASKPKMNQQFKGAPIDPSVLSQQYHGTDAGDQDGKATQAVAAFEDAEFKQSDSDTFQQTYNLSSVKIKVLGPNSGGFFGEATLDTEYIVATGRNLTTWYIAQEQFDMLAWCWKVQNMTAPPTTLSVSWGNGESGFTPDHMGAANAEFMKIGAKGTSILTASGDDGTGKQGEIFCKKFDPTWPASSPYVTAVGGTYLDKTGELGWQYSGGGFSSVFQRLSYQNSAVSAYLQTATLPPSKLFNNTGRATPDVAAFATNFKTYSSGWGSISGTSAATPVFAGYISVINSKRVAAGLPTLGFLNPTLYTLGAAGLGTDIVVGNNKAPGCPAGFPAIKGWDPVTGLGSPLYPTMKSSLMQ